MAPTPNGLASVKTRAISFPPIFMKYFVLLIVLILLNLSPSLCFSDITNEQFKFSPLPKHSTDRCTTIIVGKEASADGSTMTTHTNDCGECDFRLAKVNPKNHPKGSKRPVYTFYSAYPKIVRHDNRSMTWSPENLDQNLDQKMLEEWKSGSFHHINGYIDENDSTFGLVEGKFYIFYLYDKKIRI